MADFELRIAAASKEDLQQIVRSVATANATAREQITNLLNYQKQKDGNEVVDIKGGHGDIENQEEVDTKADAKAGKKGKKKKQDAPGNRRSSCVSTRASSSEASQDSGIQIHPVLQEAVDKTAAEQTLKICQNCSNVFDNQSEKCRYHPDAGQWLIEVESEDCIAFVRECDATDEVKGNANYSWYLRCCSMQKGDYIEGCATKEHVAMTADEGTAN